MVSNDTYKGLSCSGGGSRIDVLLASARYCLSCGYEPDWYAGSSSGLLTVLAIATGVADKVYTDLVHSKIRWMSRRPLTNSGKLSWWAYWHILTGRNYLGKQRVKEVIQSYIGKEEWQRYRTTVCKPIYAAIVCVETGEEMLVNLLDCGYGEMLTVAAASCAVPFWIEVEEMWGEHWADGGWRDHNPGGDALVREIKSGRWCTHLLSLSTRTILEDGYPKGLIAMLSKVVGVFSKGVTEEDEMHEMSVCSIHGVKRCFYRLPDCKNSPYDTDAIRSQRSVQMAMKHIETFDPKTSFVIP